MLTARVPYSHHPVVVQKPKAFRDEFPFVGFIDFQGLQIDVENCQGDTREGVDADGHEWECEMHAHYGEIRPKHTPGARGVDGDNLDVYVGPNADSSLVVVVHQLDPVTGEFDEDKVMLGFDSVEEAVVCYHAQYDRPGFYGGNDSMPIGEFWRWVHDRKHAGAPISETITVEKPRFDAATADYAE
ncbi:MAG: hypothetical protein WC869_08160 [Phycisphaerae bacterium]